ncbi:MAG: antitoxin Xre/MbcA/ParS toxin-binding domain-containing protein [Alphaproteobacteria bacterium]
MIAAQEIAAVLGGESLLRRKVRSFDDLETLVARGLPKKAALNLVGELRASADARARLLAFIASPATLKRRRERLKGDESERTERLARIIATARHVWGDEELARKFLTAPHKMLRDRAPIEVAMSELGARRVEALLWDIYYGFPV